MKDLLVNIFDSNIMHFVIVPLVVVFLGWIKNKYDIKKKNKELGYWMMKCRKLDTFIDDVMKIYTWLIVNFYVVQIILLIIHLWNGLLFSFIISAILYLLFGTLICFIVYRKIKNKGEFFTNGKSKKELIVCLYIIYWIPFFIQLYDKYVWLVGFVFSILLFIWICMLFMYCDIVFILDNRYADIYVKGSEKAQFAEAGSLEKRGEWIIVNRCINERQEEIRIKESEIVRIDYYGGPMIFVEKRDLLKKLRQNMIEYITFSREVGAVKRRKKKL